MVCQHCQMPICFDCWWHMNHAAGSRVPQALANDNFQGYVHQFIVEHQVRWIEAVIACPVFTSMVVYYIEGHKEHLLNTELGHQERTYAARGNIFSYKMPWEAIQMKMHELVSDEEMSTWPMPPVLVAQVIRLVIRNGSEQLFKKVKLLKVRPRVLYGLGRMYLEQGHGECAKTAAAVLQA